MAAVIYAVFAALAVHEIGAMQLPCPSDPHCRCTGSLALEIKCNIDGSTVTINFLPETYINIKCENATNLDYSKLPKCANKNDSMNSLKSVSFKDCPLPSSSFKDVMSNIGVSKTMALIFQNAKNLTGYFDRKHFAGLQDLTKLLLSINGVTHLPNNLFVDINKLTWLNIRSNTINLSEELFKPLERLETLEISHNHMTNISSNLFSHLSFLRKLSLWQSNVTWFSKDLFNGVDVLEELDLSSNGLNELPVSIFKPLRKLKKLTLFANKFSTLPQNLFNNNTELETVVILSNDIKLKELPKSLFRSLPNLKQIYIQRSGLEIVPFDAFANSSLITNISLAYNDIEELPESIFNDQINLLELDLSYNNLKELKPKIFSSLVRLERLDLGHNSIVTICGTTFSPLLSLIYLNMEYNGLTTVNSYMFSNNRQRMTISLAYNKLDFLDLVDDNGTYLVRRHSPFLYTYNLQLLNLSHNKFTLSHEDWWINGYENLDISYNCIAFLWDSVSGQPTKCVNEPYFKRPLKLWASHNPVRCICRDRINFFELFENSKSQMVDGSYYLECPPCLMQSHLASLPVLLISLFIALYYLYLFKIKLVSEHKKRLARLNSSTESFDVILEFAEKDLQFVENEIRPKLSSYKSVRVHYKVPVTSETNDNLTSNYIMRNNNHIENSTDLVIFSSNYLLSAYRHENFKSIEREIMKADYYTIYLFADIGPKNSLYEYLKNNRPEHTFKWHDKIFWESFLLGITRNYDKQVEDANIILKLTTPLTTYQTKPSKIACSNLPDFFPNAYDMNIMAQSQV